MKYEDLNGLSDEQLVHRELSLERELITARFRLYTNQLEDSSSIGKLRKAIARCRTAARSRERSAGLAKNALRDRFSATFKADLAAPAPKSGGSFVQSVVDSAEPAE